MQIIQNFQNLTRFKNEFDKRLLVGILRPNKFREPSHSIAIIPLFCSTPSQMHGIDSRNSRINVFLRRKVPPRVIHDNFHYILSPPFYEIRLVSDAIQISFLFPILFLRFRPYWGYKALYKNINIFFTYINYKTII